MTDPFMNIKDSMKKTLFKDFSFSKERKNAVKEAIRGKQLHSHLHRWNEDTVTTLLESIQHEPKHGFDISTTLYQKNDISFHNNEGQLYSLLHLLENKEILISFWNNGKKYYSLTTKGKKRLVAYKKGSPSQRAFLKHLLEEASL